jgi:hypothetical protein
MDKTFEHSQELIHYVDRAGLLPHRLVHRVVERGAAP